ncbi:MAG: 6-carboxytetrahydropterin synthase [Thermoanaerobaculia bacterium]
MTSPLWTLRLAKEDFKFSVAHFTLFSGERAEPLHGHNYKMAIEIGGDELDEVGLLVELDALKSAVRDLCRRLDDRVLLPAASELLEISPRPASGAAGEVEVGFRDRRYRFPLAETLLLPLANTSIELLARWAWDELSAVLPGERVLRLEVTVEETDGQSARYAAPLPRSPG